MQVINFLVSALNEGKGFIKLEFTLEPLLKHTELYFLDGFTVHQMGQLQHEVVDCKTAVFTAVE